MIGRPHILTLSRCGDKAARSPYPTNPCPCSAKVFMCNVCTCDCNAHVAPFSPPIRSHISAQGGHQGPVQMITLCGGGNRLISCSLDQTLKIFDINASTCIATLEVLALLALVGEGGGGIRVTSLLWQSLGATPCLLCVATELRAGNRDLWKDPCHQGKVGKEREK